MLRRTLQGVGALVGLGASLALLSPGCADNESSLFIEGVSILSEGECACQTDVLALGPGRLDKAASGEYSANLIVRGQLVEQSDPDRLRTETSIINIYELDVEVVDPDAGVVSSFTWPTNGIVEASAGGDRVVGCTNALLIDQAASQRIGDGNIVLATVVAHGRTTGGIELESPPWSFPIKVGTDFLIDRGPDTDDEEKPGPCDAAVEERSCYPGQDTIVGCNELNLLADG